MLGVLVIIKSIWTKELSILAEKIIKIGQQRLKLWPFITPKSVKLSSLKVFMGFFHHFHPNILCLDHSSHHNINVPTWKHDIGHKNHQNWSTETEIMAIFQIEKYRNFLDFGFSWVFDHFHPHNLCLDHSGYHNINPPMWKHDIGHKNQQNWSTETESMDIFQIKKCRIYTDQKWP